MWDQPVPALRPPIRFSELVTPRICLRGPPTSLNLDTNTRLAYPPASPHRSNALRWYRNVNLFSIAYASRPRLRDRLTLGRITLPRKPKIFGVYYMLVLFVTNTGIVTSARSICRPHGRPSLHAERSSTDPTCVGSRGFGKTLEPRYIVGARTIDQ